MDMEETNQLNEWTINRRIAHSGKDATKLSGSILTTVPKRLSSPREHEEKI